MSALTTQPLACGHPYTANEGPGTGYATDGAGNQMCYECADTYTRGLMARRDEITAYLASDGKTITTWTGGTLARVTEHGTARTGWHGSHVHYIRAVAPDGSQWYGRNGGPGMVIRLKRAKQVR